jgi:Outer membrane protein and related peptidoglycan-associated (lipo)proteins
MKLKKAILYSMLLLGAVSVSAQEIAYDFAPHWYLQGQFGGQHTLGEVSFSELNSLNAQLGLGYQFTPVFGTRFSVNGWQSKGGSIINNTKEVWKWNYVAPALDLTFNLSNLFGGYKYDRLCSFGVFAGLGANVGFKNDEAANAKTNLTAATIKQAGATATYDPLAYLWNGTKTRLVGRFGGTVDFRLSDAVSLGIELAANTLNDHYNSKRAGNADWYFNALAGIKINLGGTYTTRVIAVPVPVTNAEEKVVEKIVEKPVEVVKVVREPIRRDIFFKINSTVISEVEGVKVQDVADYLKKYPEAKVSLAGYADAGTGNNKINDRLAAQRAEKVMNVLVQKYGISVDRISYESHGSRVQPFAENDKNRVTICIAE